MNLFYADDNECDRDLFQNALDDITKSVNLLTAEDGYKALQLLEKAGAQPDIIFLDINMPFGGIECLARLRENKRFEKTPIVMYTTSDNERDVEISLKHGANLFATKPWKYEKMVTQLKQILEIDWSQYFPQPGKEKFILADR